MSATEDIAAQIAAMEAGRAAAAVPTGSVDGVDLTTDALTTIASSSPLATVFAKRANNLTDLASAATARTSLGLGGAATMSTAQIAADSALTATYAALVHASRHAPGGADDLSATYSAKRPNTVVLYGTSISAMNQQTTGTRNTYGGTYYNYSRGYWTWASALLRQRLRLVGNAGVTGNTAAQILARFDTDVAPLSPGYVVGEFATNSILTGVSLASIKSDVTAILDKISAIGALAVVLDTPPKSSSAATAAQLRVLLQYNLWLRQLAQSRKGLVVVPVHSSLSGHTSTDDWINSGTVQYTADGTHPGPFGAARMGKRLFDALDPIVPKIDVLDGGSAWNGSGVLTGLTSDINILPNIGLTGTSGSALNGSTGNVATSYNVRSANGAALAGTVTASKVARTDLYGGEWQQIAVTGSASQVRFSTDIAVASGAYAPGDVIGVQCEIETDSDFVVGTSGFFRLVCGCYNGSFQNIQAHDMSHGNESGCVFPGNGNSEVPLTRVVLRTPTVTLPGDGSVTGVLFAVDAHFLGTIRVGRPELIRNPSQW